VWQNSSSNIYGTLFSERAIVIDFPFRAMAELPSLLVRVVGTLVVTTEQLVLAGRTNVWLVP
jgi:hypothetical protein